MGNKLDNEVTLDGASPAGVARGWLEWRDTDDIQQGSIFAGFNAPVGDLGGRMTGQVAMYVRLNGTSSTYGVFVPSLSTSALYLTADGGASWKRVITET